MIPRKKRCMVTENLQYYYESNHYLVKAEIERGSTLMLQL